MSAFSTLWTVICKELRDILRDRRTLVLSLLLTPLLYPLIILGMGMLSESRVKTQVDQLLEVPTIGREYAPTLINFLAAKRLNAVAPSSDVVTAIHTQQIDVALRIDSGYADAWREGRPALVEIVYDASAVMLEIPVARLKDALNAYSQQRRHAAVTGKGDRSASGSPDRNKYLGFGDARCQTCFVDVGDPSDVVGDYILHWWCVVGVGCHCW